MTTTPHSGHRPRQVQQRLVPVRPGRQGRDVPHRADHARGVPRGPRPAARGHRRRRGLLAGRVGVATCAANSAAPWSWPAPTAPRGRGRTSSGRPTRTTPSSSPGWRPSASCSRCRCRPRPVRQRKSLIGLRKRLVGERVRGPEPHPRAARRPGAAGPARGQGVDRARPGRVRRTGPAAGRVRARRALAGRVAPADRPLPQRWSSRSPRPNGRSTP